MLIIFILMPTLEVANKGRCATIFTMVFKIQNTDLINNAREQARLSISEGFPQMLGETIVPILDASPNQNRFCNIVRRNTGTGTITIFTTPADKDFYLTYAMLSTIKDTASTATTSGINITVQGNTVSIISIAGITLTAQDQIAVATFSPPIKIDRNTVIGTTANAGVNRSDGSIAGYTVEP